MILREPIRFDKENLPPFIFKYNVAWISFIAAWFILCLPMMIATGYAFGDSIETFAAIFGLFGVLILGLIIFHIVALKLRIRLVDECAAALEKEFVDMPLEQAEQILKDNGVINDYGFIADEGDVFIADEGDVFGISTVAFDIAEFALYAHAEGSRVACIAKIQCDENYDTIRTVVVDCALYNFLQKRNFHIDLESNKDFALLINDKKNFCRRAFGFKIK